MKSYRLLFVSISMLAALCVDLHAFTQVLCPAGSPGCSTTIDLNSYGTSVSQLYLSVYADDVGQPDSTEPPGPWAMVQIWQNSEPYELGTSGSGNGSTIARASMTLSALYKRGDGHWIAQQIDYNSDGATWTDYNVDLGLGQFNVWCDSWCNRPGGSVLVNATLTCNTVKNDFEVSEGVYVSWLNWQLDWTVPAGNAQVVNSSAAQGSQSVALFPGSTAALISMDFASDGTNPSVVYVDCYTKPVADVDINAATVFDVDSARIAFVLNAGYGQLYALDGNGMGSGAWRPLAPAVALAAGNVAAAWQRLTVRLNYSAKTYDVYLNGQMIAYDLHFRLNSAAYLTNFSMKGHTATTAWLDSFGVTVANPLFTDANNDGLPDDLTRTGDADGDGLSNLRELTLGTNPRNVDSDGDGMPDAWEVNHGLNPLSNTDASRDNDGDGSTNLQEYQTGGNPNVSETSIIGFAVFTPNS